MAPRNADLFSGVVAGLAGGLAGLAVMDWIMKRTAGWVAEDGRERRTLSPLGSRHRPQESSTAALGRHAYTAVTGQEPDPELQSRLSYGVHWSYGLAVASIYGAVRARRRRPALDAEGGTLFGVALWLLGDETMVPLLGLKDSFGSYPSSQHVQALAGHVAFGLATAAGSQLARRGGKRLMAAA